MLRPQHVEQKQPYVDDACKLLLHFNGQSGSQQFIDSSNNPKVVTAYGNTCLSNSHYRFGGTSGYFDGNGDYLSIVNSSDFNFRNGDFTISMYAKTVAGSVGNHLFGQLTSDVTGGSVYGSILNSNKYRGVVIIGGAGYPIDSTNTFTTTDWHHYALIRFGGTVYLYIDGINEGTYSIGTNSIDTPTTNFIIGRAGDYTISPLTGYIDEFMCFKGVAIPIGMLYPQKRPYGYPIGGT